MAEGGEGYTIESLKPLYEAVLEKITTLKEGLRRQTFLQGASVDAAALTKATKQLQHELSSVLELKEELEARLKALGFEGEQTPSPAPAPSRTTPDPGTLKKEPNQGYILYSYVHEDTRPKSRHPMVMFGPVYSTKELAMAHGKQFHSENSTLTVYIMPLQSVDLVTTHKRYSSPEYRSSRCKEYVDAHMRSMVDAREAFNERREKELKEVRKGGKIAPPEEADGKAARPKIEEILDPKDPKDPKDSKDSKDIQEEGGEQTVLWEWKNVHQVTTQRFLVVIFVLPPKSSPEKEFVIYPIAVFETREEAKAYAGDQASKKNPEFDCMVVDLYAQLDPFEAEEHRHEVVTQMRDAEHQLIMDAPEKERQRVRDFTSRCEADGIAPPITTISPTDASSVGVGGNIIQPTDMVTESGRVYKTIPSIVAGVSNDIENYAPVSMIPPGL